MINVSLFETNKQAKYYCTHLNSIGLCYLKNIYIYNLKKSVLKGSGGLLTDRSKPANKRSNRMLNPYWKCIRNVLFVHYKRLKCRFDISDVLLSIKPFLFVASLRGTMDFVCVWTFKGSY